MRLLIACVFLTLSSCAALAQDSFTRNYVVTTSLMSYAGQVEPSPVWLSSFASETKPQYFATSSGAGIMANPASIVSAYDSGSSRYDMSGFYALKSDRYKLISHLNGFSKGEIFTVGYDTGINSQKLSVSNALFIGYAKSISVTSASVFNLSLGSWFGGRTKEAPCSDGYNRQYSCQTLTAWSDYRPNYPKPLSYIDLKYIVMFD